MLLSKFKIGSIRSFIIGRFSNMLSLWVIGCNFFRKFLSFILDKWWECDNINDAGRQGAPLTLASGI